VTDAPGPGAPEPGGDPATGGPGPSPAPSANGPPANGTAANGTAAGAPPGWYPTPHGVARWWDGAQWGPWATSSAAPLPVPVPATGTDNAKTLVIVSHLGCVLGGFILPLVVYLVEKRDPFVRFHAAEALNFQLTVLLVLVVSVPLMLLIVGFFTFLAAAVLNWVWGIMAAIKGGQGQWWRYPVNIRFVKP
jgi:uncharacterized Tic20 family protein